MRKKLGSSVKIPSLVITPLGDVRAEELVEYEPVVHLIRLQAPIGIAKAIQENKEEATIVEINNSGHFITIPSKYWKNALTTCLQHYIEVEDFEKCAEIHQIEKQLDAYFEVPSSTRIGSKKTKGNGRK